jgi:hypothetical protein
MIMSGTTSITESPDWVRHYWKATLQPTKAGSDYQEYDEVNDFQVFVFVVTDFERSYFKDLHAYGDVKKVKLWELPEGDIEYQAY